MNDIKQDYIQLIEQYISKNLSADNFVERYLGLFLNEKRDYGDNLHFILDELFVYVHGYTDDLNLLEDDPEFNFNESQLLSAATKAFQELQGLS